MLLLLPGVPVVPLPLSPGPVLVLLVASLLLLLPSSRVLPAPRAQLAVKLPAGGGLRLRLLDQLDLLELLGPLQLLPDLLLPLPLLQLAGLVLASSDITKDTFLFGLAGLSSRTEVQELLVGLTGVMAFLTDNTRHKLTYNNNNTVIITRDTVLEKYKVGERHVCSIITSISE